MIKKIGSGVGILLIIVWIGIFFAYLITNDKTYLSPFILLSFFVVPMSWGVLESLLSDDLKKRLGSVMSVNAKIISRIFQQTTIIIFGILSLASFLAGASILVYQVYMYLKGGDWLSFSIISMLNYFGSGWSSNPSNWIGLWKALDKVPLTIFSVVLGALFLIIFDRLKTEALLNRNDE